MPCHAMPCHATSYYTRYTPEQSLVLEVIGITVNFGILQVNYSYNIAECGACMHVHSNEMKEDIYVESMIHGVRVLSGLEYDVTTCD